jgi:hypothetical protein
MATWSIEQLQLQHVWIETREKWETNNKSQILPLPQPVSLIKFFVISIINVVLMILSLLQIHRYWYVQDLSFDGRLASVGCCGSMPSAALQREACRQSPRKPVCYFNGLLFILPKFGRSCYLLCPDKTSLIYMHSLTTGWPSLNCSCWNIVLSMSLPAE